MPRFRNDTGSVLTVNDLMRQVGPSEEFDWPGYDPEVHGAVPGCTWLDAPQDPESGETAGKPSRKRGNAPAEQDKETSA